MAKYIGYTRIIFFALLRKNILFHKNCLFVRTSQRYFSLDLLHTSMQTFYT